MRNFGTMDIFSIWIVRKKRQDLDANLRKKTLTFPSTTKYLSIIRQGLIYAACDSQNSKFVTVPANWKEL